MRKIDALILAKAIELSTQSARLSFEAFRLGGYPPYFECFLTALLQVVQLGSAAVMHATPKVSLHQFSLEVDALADFLREIKTIVTASNAIKIY